MKHTFVYLRFQFVLVLTSDRCLDKRLLYFDRERFCNESLRCDGKLDCSWLAPDDEENCTVCPPNKPLRCDCNKEGNNSCEWNGEDRLSSCVFFSGRKYSRDK